MNKGYSTIYVEKTGLFSSRKLTISLTLHDDRLTGNALKVVDNLDYVYQNFSLKYDEITNCEELLYKDTKAIKIEAFINLQGNALHNSYIFPFESETNIQEIINKVLKNVSYYKAMQKSKLERQNKKVIENEERKEHKRLHLLELEKFFNSTYNFHIDKNTPVYTLDKSDLLCFALYIGKEKSINFLYIDAASKSEIHSVISYDEIHYYEKAGAVHYATNINAKYTGSQSFGGSFVGGKVSASAATLGGLLFDPMGMAVGAMLSYKPA